MMTDFNVIPFDSDYFDDLLNLWEDHYGFEMISNRRELFLWLTEKNPFVQGRSSYYLLRHGRRIIGMHGHMPLVFSVNGRRYSGYIAHDDLLALGYRGNVIRDYFLNYEFYSNDFTVNLKNKKEVKVHGKADDLDWTVTLVETGDDTMTGARIKQCEKYITGDDFMVTYGDGLANVDIAKLAKYHIDHKKIGTLTGVRPPGRYGELKIEDNQVVSFMEKARPEGSIGDINGGFMVFKKKFFEYLTTDSGSVLEKDTLEKLACEKELMVYHHEDYWQCMDHYRDYLLLVETWNSGKAPWMFE